MDRLEKIKRRILEFRDSRDWQKYHTVENLSKSISIEAAELLEVFQWGDAYDLEDITEELADILIYALLLSEAIQVDPFKIIEDKINKNEKRFPADKVYGTSGKHTKEEL